MSVEEILQAVHKIDKAYFSNNFDISETENKIFENNNAENQLQEQVQDEKNSRETTEELIATKENNQELEKFINDYELLEKIRKFEKEQLPKKPELLENLNCTYSSWIEKIENPDGTVSTFLFYENEDDIKSRLLNPNNVQDREVEIFLNEIEKYDLLKPSTKKLRSERKTFVTAISSPFKTLEEAQAQGKVPEYLDKLIGLVDERIAVIEGQSPEAIEKEPDYSLTTETRDIIEKISELSKKGYISESAAKDLNKSPQIIDYIITNNTSNTLYVFYTNSLIESFDNVFSNVCVRTNEGKWQSEEVKDFIKAVENEYNESISLPESSIPEKTVSEEISRKK